MHDGIKASAHHKYNIYVSETYTLTYKKKNFHFRSGWLGSVVDLPFRTACKRSAAVFVRKMAATDFAGVESGHEIGYNDFRLIDFHVAAIRDAKSTLTFACNMHMSSNI